MNHSEARDRLLVVEDDDRLREILSDFLRTEGYEVTEASDGFGALRLLDDRRTFQLALVDLDLPGCSGLEVCRQLRRRYPSLPVIVCSGSIDPYHRSSLYQLGVYELLSKPYLPEALRERIAVRICAAA